MAPRSIINTLGAASVVYKLKARVREVAIASYCRIALAAVNVKSEHRISC